MGRPATPHSIETALRDAVDTTLTRLHDATRRARWRLEADDLDGFAEELAAVDEALEVLVAVSGDLERRRLEQLPAGAERHATAFMNRFWGTRYERSVAASEAVEPPPPF
jgi:hypothetical protein